MPSLSIIIPIYNGEDHLPKLKETFSALDPLPEIVFVDDGSTDNSKTEIQKHFPQAHYIFQNNSGVATARNTGAKTATQDYLLFLDCDDLLNTEELWGRVALAEKEMLDVLTSSWRMEVHQNGEIKLEDIRAMKTPDNLYNALMAGNWWGPLHAYIVKRTAYWGIGGADENLVNAQDFDVWIRLAIANNKWGSSPRLAGHYFRNLDQTSLARGSRKQYWTDTETVINKAFQLLESTRTCTPDQRLITAQRLHDVARNIYSIDRIWYQDTLKRIYEICPNFKAKGSFSYRSLTRILGVERSEHIAQLKIKLQQDSVSQLESCDVLAVIYARLEDYPSSKFQVEILREAGLKVTVIEDNVPNALTSSRYQKLLNCYLFKKRVQTFIKNKRPKLIIAYDTFGMYFTGKPWKQSDAPKTMWHFHELPHILEPSLKVPGNMVKRAEAFIINHLGDVNALVFPDANRGQYIKEKTQTSTRIYNVMNCPRLREPHDGSEMSRFKEKHGIPEDSAVIYFHGALAESRCLDTVIESMTDWDRDSHFIMIGPVESAYLKKLENLIQNLELQTRVHYFPPLPYETVMALAAGAQVGISIVHKDNQPNWRFSAGAVNKRFEYMAMGLPQITNNGAGVAELIDNPSCGRVLEGISPQAIATAVNALLNKPHQLDRMRQNGLNQHATRYHYETQFAELKTQIISWLQTTS